MTLVYYDAKTGKVYSLDAGYNSYRNETEPKSIPVADMGPMNEAVQAARGEHTSGQHLPRPKARDAKRWSRVSWRESRRCIALRSFTVFRPVRAGHLVCRARSNRQPPLVGCFQLRREFLARTPEGEQFLKQAGNGRPRPGGRFIQAELAGTLRAVAKGGSRYMYTGPWGHEFVKIVQREGGKVTIDDMAQYGVVWSEPLATTFATHQIYTAGLPSHAAYNILPALNLAEELKLDKRPAYWQDPKSLRDLQRISDVIDNAPQLDSRVASILRVGGSTSHQPPSSRKPMQRRSLLARSTRGHVPKRAASLQRGCRDRQGRKYRGHHAHHQFGDLGRHGNCGRRYPDPHPLDFSRRGSRRSRLAIASRTRWCRRLYSPARRRYWPPPPSARR